MLSTVLSRRVMRCESAVIVFFGLCECLMTGLRRFTSRFLPIVTAALLSVVSTLRAENCCDPKGPFTLGEEYPEEPATCETIKYWADRAPRTEDRISLGITGKLKAVKFDGTLAYLLMCEPPGVQVMCVTYSTNGLEAGDVVLFGGGYRRVGERQIMLDPCLASR
jgi:hypothetical protein